MSKDDAYRGDLEAARARADALERELRELKEQRGGPSPDPADDESLSAIIAGMEKEFARKTEPTRRDAIEDEKTDPEKVWKSRYHEIMGMDPPEKRDFPYIPGVGAVRTSDEAGDHFLDRPTPLRDAWFWLTLRWTAWVRAHTSNHFVRRHAQFFFWSLGLWLFPLTIIVMMIGRGSLLWLFWAYVGCWVLFVLEETFTILFGLRRALVLLAALAAVGTVVYHSRARIAEDFKTPVDRSTLSPLNRFRISGVVVRSNRSDVEVGATCESHFLEYPRDCTLTVQCGKVLVYQGSGGCRVDQDDRGRPHLRGYTDLRPSDQDQTPGYELRDDRPGRYPTTFSIHIWDKATAGRPAFDLELRTEEQ